MRSSAFKRRLASAAAVAALAAVALPVIGQEAPQSILPPGFDDAPASVVTAPAAPVPGAEPPTPAPGGAPAAPGTAPVAPLPGATPATGPVVDPLLTAAPSSGRVGPIGWLTPQAGGYGDRTFSGSNGAFVAGLMRRIDAPVASRWAHIVLRRALLSMAPAPAGVRPGDWVAERAWLLVRMGEVDGAKALVDAMPLDRFTPRLYAVAAQAHLAAADLPGLCPLGATARALSREPLWPLVEAMCAGLEGDDSTSVAIIDGLREREGAQPFDIQLAERVANAGQGAGRAANVEWDGSGPLTVYRFGVANAAGIPIPAAMIESARPQVHAWALRHPASTLEARVALAPAVAATGVSSSAELVKLYAAQAEELDPFALDAAPAGKLRIAFAARRPEERLAAMRTLWAQGESEAERYGERILTARAAALLPVDDDFVDAAPELVGSMLSAGNARAATRWWPLADKAGGETRDRTWALLAVADPSGRVPADESRFDNWLASERSRLGEARANRRAQLLLAGLAGLGRADWAGDRLEDLGAEPLDNAWTRRLDAAAAGGRLGEVAVLAGVGLQRGWASVPPQYLARILAAYRRVGRGGEARMIAAEAVTRG
jgi:hypothetical protein